VKFKELKVGDSFDFVSSNRMMNSFYLRSTKTSIRGYRDENGVNHKIGSIDAIIYNVIGSTTIVLPTSLQSERRM
jgi:hypothetical protein